MNCSINEEIERHLSLNRASYLEGLKEFVSIPSVSAKGTGMTECAEWLAKAMQELGIETEILPTAGSPAVYGELSKGTSHKTLLVYGHYDVQPPDPVVLWKTDPFEPQVIDDHLYGRGATDDKGNIWAVLMGLKTAVAVGDTKLNLKFLFEGEEEVGSPHLPDIVKTQVQRLSADYGLLCDRGIHESGRPQMYLGNKGIVKVELRVKEGKREVHSGHAPLIPNAAWELVWALNATKDRHNRILVEGFSTSANPPSEEDLKLLAMIPFDPENFRQEYGIKKTLKDGSPQEMLAHLLFTPTANISGMASGYYGEGSKTVIPNEAIAKMDFRLVDGQTSKEAKEKIGRHFESLGLDGLSCELLGSMEPSKTSPNAPSVKAAIESAKEAYGSEPVVWPLLDGSGPLALFTPCLKVPMFVVGLGAPFSRANTHAPNENIGLNEFYRGISFMANYYHRLGKMGR